MWQDHGISKNKTLWFIVFEDQGTRVETKPLDSKYWHWKLYKEYNSREEPSTENLRKLYYRALWST